MSSNVNSLEVITTSVTQVAATHDVVCENTLAMTESVTKEHTTQIAEEEVSNEATEKDIEMGAFYPENNNNIASSNNMHHVFKLGGHFLTRQ